MVKFVHLSLNPKLSIDEYNAHVYMGGCVSRFIKSNWKKINFLFLIIKEKLHLNLRIDEPSIQNYYFK
jgi:hypothetical protein